MIFKTALETFEYINTLLDRGVTISPQVIEKICRLNDIHIKKSTLIHGDNKKPQLDKVELLDNGAFILVYKQDSWMNSLPSLYHDNEFLERFLFGFEQEHLQTQLMLDDMHELFNPSKTEFVNWLASWVGIAFSKEVGERAKRRVLHNIVYLYKIRGTKEYFIKLIKYLCDITINIDDGSVVESMHHTLVKKVSNTKMFIVHIENKENCSDQAISLMKAILDKEKPIGVNYRLSDESTLDTVPDVVKASIELHSEDMSYDYDDYERWD